MKRLLIIGCMIGAFGIANAQDLIYFRNGAQQNGRVLQVGAYDLTYKKAENPNGPNYVCNKSDISMIEYQNGNRELMGANVVNNSNTANYNQPANNQQYYNQPVNNQQYYSQPAGQQVVYQQQPQVYVAPAPTYVRPQVVVVPPVYNGWGWGNNYYGGGYGYNNIYLGGGGYRGGWGGGYGGYGHHGYVHHGHHGGWR